ncbi:MAG TPA: hypothetical protein VKA46_27975 [Gemmataceae bacterium]|nr:hypothetical protein [Gemmataceae bacterium]
MGDVHRPRQHLDQGGRFSRRHRGAGELLVQGPAVAEFQGEIGQSIEIADFVDLHDVGVLQAGDGLGLGAEAPQVVGGGVDTRQDHLQRHQAVEPNLTCQVDDAHAASAQFAEDLVARQRGTRCR